MGNSLFRNVPRLSKQVVIAHGMIGTEESHPCMRLTWQQTTCLVHQNLRTSKCLRRWIMDPQLTSAKMYKQAALGKSIFSGPSKSSWEVLSATKPVMMTDRFATLQSRTGQISALNHFLTSGR